jgi:secondary thiamine-phosphate synthase enzyme
MLDRVRIQTHERCELVDITGQVQKTVEKRKINDGVLYVYCPHTTAAITINENCDPSVQSDITATLNKLVPHHGNYEHAEGNADAHVKASMVGSSRTLFIEKGAIALGTWQGIYLCEFDGPRTREVWIKIIKE